MLPYSEVQRFRQPFLWFFLIGLFGLLLWSNIKQIILKQPVGSNAAPDWVLVLILFVFLFVMLFFFFLRLETRIDDAGVSFRFVPFHFKTKFYSWGEIEKIYTCEYRPIAEYGGWGVRYSLRKKRIAYNVSGKNGIQLILKNGKHILIGTQNPEDVNKVIEKIREKNKID